jgi:hypothetical protein
MRKCLLWGNWFHLVAALQHALEAIHSFTRLNAVVCCSRFVRALGAGLDCADQDG